VIDISKIPNDKYYTSPELAEYCVNKTEVFSFVVVHIAVGLTNLRIGIVKLK
jgi:hypothetical protein